mmetsp:Transcript_13802/g.24520  ORF Transcript_13802/g.24520 Transcript_13802/m.24520 type:complete len:713 (+) Transcript_13802:257-2395(+)
MKSTSESVLEPMRGLSIAGERVRRLVTSFSSPQTEGSGGKTARSILADLAKARGHDKSVTDSSRANYAELWDGLDICMEQASGTKQTTKELANGLSQWSSAEKDYIKSLPFTKKKFELPPCEQGSIGSTLETFFESFGKIAETRARLGSVVGAMGTQLHQFRREQNQTKRQLEMEGTKLRKGMVAQELAFQRAKQKYEKACKDADICISLKEKAHQEKALHEVSRLWQRTTDALIAVQESEQQYRLAVEELRAYRSNYTQAMQQVLREFQILEESRVEYIKALMHGVVDSYTELSNQFQQTLCEMNEKVDQTDSAKDVEDFVKKNLRQPLEPVTFEKCVNEKIQAEIEILVGGGIGPNNIAGRQCSGSTRSVKGLSPKDSVSVTPKIGSIPQQTVPPVPRVPPPGSNASTPSPFCRSNSSSLPPPLPTGGPPPIPSNPVNRTAIPHIASEPSQPANKIDDVSQYPPVNQPAEESQVESRPKSPDSPLPAEVAEPELEGLFVRAVFAYTAEEDSELSIQAGDIIRVIEQDDSGWWEGELKDGTSGSFPCNYTKTTTATMALAFGFTSSPASPEAVVNEAPEANPTISCPIPPQDDETSLCTSRGESDENGASSPCPVRNICTVAEKNAVAYALNPALSTCAYEPPCKQVIVIFDYDAQDPGDLTIKKRQLLTIHGIDKDGGWLDASDADGKRGMVPANYVRNYAPRPESALSA